MERIRLEGTPNAKQQAFFDARARYIAYGGARGGGKSWALRRKLILMSLRYPGLRTMILRRSYSQLRENHILPLQSEIGKLAQYSETAKTFVFPNGSRIRMGYCATESDVLQYQGQEYDIIAIDEATQLTEYQFQTLKACIRGVNAYPKRMYLTCNPGGVGHAWVKRLFVDRQYRAGEDPDEYAFISAKVYDNAILCERDTAYVQQLQSLPEKLRRAWLDGEWDLFEGQFFSEFRRDVHTVMPYEIPTSYPRFCAMDYGFDMLCVLWLAVSPVGTLTVYRELCVPNLTLSQAADAIAKACQGEALAYLVASPDLWNRRQDSGVSGVEILSRNRALPPLLCADDRRVIGWRTLREYLQYDELTPPRLQIFSSCTELIRCLPALLFDRHNAEDASSSPHAVTHAPEALRYAVMSRAEQLAAPSSWQNAYGEIGTWL
jgi:phage terminase large subunit